MATDTNKRIAILGSTSHIARGLIHAFCAEGTYELFLFARKPERTAAFLKGLSGRERATTGSLETFTRSEYDVVVNCIGAGDPAKVRALGGDIFQLTETFDNRVMDFLSSHPTTLYVNFSSGAVYGTSFNNPAGDRVAMVNINDLSPENWYGISKLHSEAKHRARPDLWIIDIRIFAYFSRYIDLDSRFLLADAVNCILEKRILETGPDDIVRDYLHPSDLHQFVTKCIEAGPRNQAFDAYSREPAKKFQVLELLKRFHGLQYRISENAGGTAPTGIKKNYYSISTKARSLGYEPQYTSLDCIRIETDALLRQAGMTQ